MRKTQQLLQSINNEAKTSLDFVVNKRQQFRDRYQLYTQQAKDTNKISINTMYFAMNTMLAMFFDDRMTVEFQPRILHSDDLADKIQMLAEYDYTAMQLDKMNYITQWNRLFFGVGIRALSSWDENKQIPVFKNVSPLSWFPDPELVLDPNTARWHGFDTLMTKNQLENSGISSYESITAGRNDQQVLDSNAQRQQQGLNFNDVNPDTPDSDVYSVYYHFFSNNNKKYMAILGNDRTKILSIEEIKHGDEEPMYPITLNYYSPLPGNPFGTSVPDLLEDKQRAQTLLANLMLHKEKEFAFGDDILFDPSSIKNKNDLVNVSFGRKFIPADLRSNPNPLMAVPKNPSSASSYSMSSFLDNEIKKETQVDQMRSWVISDKSMTATEAQATQSNANLQNALKNKINNFGERDFWRLWYRSYKENFGKKDKKVIRIASYFGNKTQAREIFYRDFISNEDPDITIESQADAFARQEKDKMNFMAIFPIITQDPNKPQIAKIMAERKLLRLNGLSPDEIYAVCPKTPYELDAEQKLDLLNHNNMEGAVINSPDEDHYTYLLIFQRALDTDAKRYAIMMREQALINSGQMNQNQMTQNNSASNTATGMLMNNANQANSNSLPTM